MLAFSNNGYLIQQASELWQLPRPGINSSDGVLYLDFETASNDSRYDSLNPWLAEYCKPIGFVYTITGHEYSYFIPWELAQSVDPESGSPFWYCLFAHCRIWINHNIKYDAHVLCNATNWQLPDSEDITLICTIVLAHLLDADRSYKGGYALDALSYHWLSRDMRRYYDSLKRYTHKGKNVFNRDYGQIPVDILAEYACEQIQANRDLYYFCMRNMPPEAQEGIPCLLHTEIRFTRVLFDIENTGLYLDPLEVKIAQFKCLARMLNIEDALEKHLGYSINPKSRIDVYDLIVNRYGQPVRKWTNTDDDGNKTEKSNPSFDGDTLKEYREDIDTPPELKQIIVLLLDYVYQAQHNSLYYKKWLKFCVPVDEAGRLDKLRSRLAAIHSTYNQNVRSGRLSCEEPSSQQLDEIVKALIIPLPGYCILSCDYSQIEYRLMGHDTESARILNAYAADPDTDFHDFIQRECEIEHRRPAKNINFMMGFGGGKKKNGAHAGE